MRENTTTEKNPDSSLKDLGYSALAVTPVKISFPFFQHAFGLHKTSEKEVGRISTTGIDLMVILHKICNTHGVIRYTNRHQIYTRYKDYFLKHSSPSQFYKAFDRFLDEGLLTEEYDQDRELYTYTLQHFLKENEKPERFATIHPIVFSSSFRSLSLGARKLFFMVAMRQEKKGQKIYMSLHGVKGLYKRLRKSLPIQLKDAIHELQELKILEYGHLVKVKGISHEAVFTLSASYHWTKAEGEYARDPIKPVERYPRKVKLMKDLLQSKGLGELADQAGAFIHLFKKVGNRVIRHIVRELHHYVKSTNSFPRLEDFIKKQTRRESERKIADLAYEYELAEHVTRNLGPIEREDALHRFAVNVNRVIPLDSMRQAFRKAKKALQTYGTRVVQVSQEDYYTYGLLGSTPEMSVVIDRAYTLGIDPAYFKHIIRKAEYSLLEGTSSVESSIDWVLAALNTVKEEQKVSVRYLISEPMDQFVIRIWNSPSFKHF